jgi:hypothetical protein
LPNTPRLMKKYTEDDLQNLAERVDALRGYL